jgi:spore germination protein GerM
MRRVRSVVAACAVGIAGLTGCGVSAESSPRHIDDAQLPAALQVEHASTTTVGTALVPLQVWFVRDNRLVPATHQVEAPLTAAKAVADLVLGPTDSESASLRSAIPDPQVIVEATVLDGTATVVLAEAFNQIPTADQVLAIGQLVLTLTSLSGIDQVQFRLGQTDVAVPLPDGTTSVFPVGADDFTDLISS